MVKRAILLDHRVCRFKPVTRAPLFRGRKLAVEDSKTLDLTTPTLENIALFKLALLSSVWRFSQKLLRKPAKLCKQLAMFGASNQFGRFLKRNNLAKYLSNVAQVTIVMSQLEL